MCSFFFFFPVVVGEVAVISGSLGVIDWDTQKRLRNFSSIPHSPVNPWSSCKGQLFPHSFSLWSCWNGLEHWTFRESLSKQPDNLSPVLSTSSYKIYDFKILDSNENHWKMIEIQGLFSKGIFLQVGQDKGVLFPIPSTTLPSAEQAKVYTWHALMTLVRLVSPKLSLRVS